MNVYGRLREGRLSNVLEQVAENINTQKKSAIYVQKKTSGENEEAVTLSTPEVLEDNTAMEVGGIEPRKTPHLRLNKSTTEGAQNSANAEQSTSSLPSDQPTSKHNDAKVEHKYDESKQEKCVICVSQDPNSMPRDLADVVLAWDQLPDEIKSSILTMVKVTQQNGGGA